MFLDGDPCDAGSVLAVLDPNILTLNTWDILIDSKADVIAIASHGLFARSSNLVITGIVGIDLRDLATLFDGVSF
jgi:hypothetical protein